MSAPSTDADFKVRPDSKLRLLKFSQARPKPAHDQPADSPFIRKARQLQQIAPSAARIIEDMVDDVLVGLREGLR